MSRATKIGAACVEIGKDKEANLEVIRQYMEQAASDDVEFLAFGECTLQGYPLGLGVPDLDEYEHQRRDAEPVPGPATDLLVEFAQKYELEVVVGLNELPTEPGTVGMLFNTVVVVGPNGVIAKYRKIHTGDVEKCLWNRGTNWVVADSVAGKLGLMICYDLVFPETARCLALEGAELLVMSTAWTQNDALREAYELFTRARPIENQVYLMVANLVGGVPGPRAADTVYYGHSRIIDPRGHIIAESEGPGIAVAEVDIREGVVEARARGWWGLSHLANREPDVYSAISRKFG